MVFKKKQTAVDEQIAEIDKLNAVINAAERDMLKLRKVSAPSKMLITAYHLVDAGSQCITLLDSLLSHPGVKLV